MDYNDVDVTIHKTQRSDGTWSSLAVAWHKPSGKEVAEIVHAGEREICAEMRAVGRLHLLVDGADNG